ncbi:MAG: hypothetical protein D3M94_01445 [Rhodocyclales bacterium GT-UBC]|nr:MAG: hypothetical protein D3M94_01445 [Rhodocyclales bacterium GT-UBC]
MKWQFDRACRQGMLAGLLTALCLAAGAAIFLHAERDQKEIEARAAAEAFASRITQRTYETVSPVYMLASMVKLNRGEIPEFDQVASDLLQEFPLARALELAPAGVVRQVYPLRGNEAVLGHDLLKDRGRNREAHLAVFRRQMMVAGPFELIQGGLGAVARYPVFLMGDQGKASFWGFAIVLFHVKELLTSAGSMEIERKGYAYQICRVMPDADGGECKVFAQSSAAELCAPLGVTVDLPNNTWRLSVAPLAGWIDQGHWLAAIAIVVLGGLAAGYARWQACRQAADDAGCDESTVAE